MSFLPAVDAAAEHRRKPEGDEVAHWLKKTVGHSVSLPSLKPGPRPDLWSRAEGRDSPLISPSGDEDSWLRRTAGGNKALMRVAPKWADIVDPVDMPSGSDAPDLVKSRSLRQLDKGKRLKQIDLVAREYAHADKHRQLKTMLRERRHAQQSLFASKFLVEKPSKVDPWRRKALDQAQVEQSVRRIEGQLNGCSNARQELLELQRKMAETCGPERSPLRPSICSDLKMGFADALRRQHTCDDM
jgi:hypothetical protein